MRTLGRAAAAIVAVLTASILLRAQTSRPSPTTLPGVPVPDDSVLTMGNSLCPVAVIGEQPFDLRTMAPAGPALRGVLIKNEPRNVSPDGKLMAIVDRRPQAGPGAIMIASTTTGAPVKILHVNAGGTIIRLFFATNDVLLASPVDGTPATLFDLRPGGAIRPLPPNAVRDSDQPMAASPDGRYLAVLSGRALRTPRSLSLYNLTSGGLARTFSQPPMQPDAYQAPVDPSRDPVPPAPFLENVAALAFSPDSRELAVLGTYPLRLVVFNLTGQITFDSRVRGALGSTVLAWLPDATGWLVNGAVFMRDSRRVVMNRPLRIFRSPFQFLLSKDLMATYLGKRGEGRFVQIALPWDAVKKATAAMNRSDTPAFLRHGDTVSIAFKTESTHLDLNADPQFQEILTDRLAADGIKVAPHAPLLLTVTMVETEESITRTPHTAPIHLTRFAFNGQLTNAAGTATYWKADVESVGVQVVSAPEIREATLPKVAGEFAGRTLEDFPLPYFIPRDPAVGTLPAPLEQ